MSDQNNPRALNPFNGLSNLHLFLKNVTKTINSALQLIKLSDLAINSALELIKLTVQFTILFEDSLILCSLINLLLKKLLLTPLKKFIRLNIYIFGKTGKRRSWWGDKTMNEINANRWMAYISLSAWRRALLSLCVNLGWILEGYRLWKVSCASCIVLWPSLLLLEFSSTPLLRFSAHSSPL